MSNAVGRVPNTGAVTMPDVGEEMGAILIVNVLPVLRTGLRHVLQDAGLASTIHEADSTHEAQTFIGPDLRLIIVDPAEPGGHPAAFVQQLRKTAGNIPILFFGDNNAPLLLSLAIRLEVNGYLCKLSNEKTIVATIQMVLDGMRCFPSQAATHYHGGRINTLSQRELSILLLLRQGLRNIDIARKLYLSEKTVSAHKRNIMLKLDVSSISQISDNELLNAYCDKGPNLELDLPLPLANEVMPAKLVSPPPAVTLVGAAAMAC